MKNLSRILALSGIALLTACGEPGEHNNEYQAEYQSQTQSNETKTDKKDESIKEADGRITLVDNGFVTFNEGMGDSQRDVSHQFKWVILEGIGDPKQSELTLIYPFSRPIKQKFARIRYRPLEGNQITVNEFLKKYVKGCSSDDNFTLHANGVIIGGETGIVYR